LLGHAGPDILQLHVFFYAHGPLELMANMERKNYLNMMIFLRNYISNSKGLQCLICK